MRRFPRPSPDRMLRQRKNMVAIHLRARGVSDERVLTAMSEVPREAFVDDMYVENAYDDSPLPIGEQQSISQPYIVAVMAQAAGILPTDRILEIGTGSGYAAAVLAELGADVFTVERFGTLAGSAERTFAELGLTNIRVRTGDGTLGWEEEAPFDVIIVSASGPRIPEALKKQLKVGGRLVMPVEADQRQSLLRLERTSEDSFHVEDLGQVRFVPLIGEEGWVGPPGNDDAGM